jgi:hypothetical protein
MDSLISPGLTTYASVQGQEYRMTGLLQGSVTDAQAQTALTQAGFSSLNYYAGDMLPPSDWPTENMPLVSTGESIFRAVGTWMNSTPIPTAITVSTGNSVIIYQLWSHLADLPASTLTPAQAVVSPALPSTVNNVWWRIGGAGAMIAAGYFAGSALMAAIKQNPIKFESTVIYRGIPIHVHLEDGIYCADYTALHKIAPWHGGKTCSKKKERAVEYAKLAIDRGIGRAPLPKPKTYPSPFD